MAPTRPQLDRPALTQKASLKVPLKVPQQEERGGKRMERKLQLEHSKELKDGISRHFNDDLRRFKPIYRLQDS